MDVLQTFGVNWQLLIAQVINFLIVLYLLKRFLYKPVFNLLKKREQTIKEGLAKADESKKALAEAETKEKKIIKEAQDTAKKIVQDAKEQAIDVAKEIEERAKKQADRMLADAKVQIAIETKKAEQQLNQHISQLSIEILKKSLGNVFGEKEQAEIVTKAAKVLTK
ncbi:MAG TPA: F0F1 ATP synthase subunit B, partial [Patescibacteria group bacterium]